MVRLAHDSPAKGLDVTDPSTTATPGDHPVFSRYDAEVRPDADNNSHALQLQLVGSSKRVLEFGCAAGHMTKALHAQGCHVTGLDWDAEAASHNTYADQILIADLDRDDFVPMLEGAVFDVVLLGDVLEHLRDPLETMRRARAALAPGGYAVVSAPNFAHVDVRLALLDGRFEYRDAGLLDRTHLHFFTGDSLDQLLSDAGLLPVEHHRILVDLFCTEVGANVDIPRDIVERALLDPEALTYQFVVKAALDDGDHATRQLATRCRELEDLLHERRREEMRREEELALARNQATDLEDEVVRLRDALSAVQDENLAIRESKTFRLASAIGHLGRIPRPDEAK